jgi:apolipoprotein N-acyltransferase
MASASNYRRLVTALLVIAATAVMIWFGNGLNPWWPLMWFAPLPVLIFALRNSWWSAAITALLGIFLGTFNMWHYLHNVLGTPFPAFAAIFFTFAVVFAVSVLLFRALALRGATWSAALAFPALWVASEYLRNLTTPHGTAGSFAYTQLNFLPFLQLASITGPWGMSFVLLFFSACIAIAWHLRQTAPKQAMRILGTGLGLTAAVLLFGAIRLAIPTNQQQVKVGLVTSDVRGNLIATEGPDTERLFHAYASEAEKLSARGAQVIVIPEKTAVLVDPDTHLADAILQSAADKTGSTIIAGVVHVDSPVKYNEARVYQPAASMRSYDKQHMLPPFESDLKPGTDLTLLQRPSQTWGVAICKDMDFANPARQNGQAGVGLMLVPGWDFNIDGFWHGHIAVMRGVEDGFSVARSAKDGFLTVSDSRGRILGETLTGSAPFATLLTEVPATHVPTLYLLFGDWFAWSSIAILAFTLVQLALTLSRRNSAVDVKAVFS